MHGWEIIHARNMHGWKHIVSPGWKAFLVPLQIVLH
jgi:hypothetical protein